MVYDDPTFKKFSQVLSESITFIDWLKEATQGMKINSSVYYVTNYMVVYILYNLLL